MGPKRDYTSYLIDIEGVLVRDKAYQPIAGSLDWYNGLAQRGIAHVLVSNNTTHAPEELVGDLQAAGFQVAPDNMVSALQTGAELLQGWGKTRILWLGAARLTDWWRKQGFTLVREGACDAVVLGLNTEIGIDDLDRVLPSLVDHGAELVALHRNTFYLDAAGHRRFGPGFYASAFESASHREAVTIGKPKERIYRLALNRVGGDPEKALFISDDPIADLVTAKRMGMGTAFVLSGKYPDHTVLGRMAEADWPEIIADRPATLDD